MATNSKRTLVRGYWEVRVKGKSDTVFVSHDRVVSTPRYLNAVEAELRRKLLGIVEDAEGLNLDQSRGWWANVAAAAHAKPRANAR